MLRGVAQRPPGRQLVRKSVAHYVLTVTMVRARRSQFIGRLVLLTALSFALGAAGCGAEVTVFSGALGGAGAGASGTGAAGAGAAGTGGAGTGGTGNGGSGAGTAGTAGSCADDDPGQPWALRFGDSLRQHAVDVAVDGECNVVVIGFFAGNIDFGSGTMSWVGSLPDLFLAKFDPSGSPLWSKAFDQVSQAPQPSLAIDPATSTILLAATAENAIDFGGGTMPAGGQRDVVIAKFDGAGNHLFSKRFGDAELQHTYAAVVDGVGNLAITGQFEGTIDFGGGTMTSQGERASFVARFGPMGNHLASWSIVGDQHSLMSLSRADADQVLLGGILSGPGTLDFGGGQEVSGHADACVVRYGPTGMPIFSAIYGDSGPDIQSIRGTTVDSAHDIVLAGVFHGGIDFGGGPLTTTNEPWAPFVAKLSPAGSPLWSLLLPTGYADGAARRVVAYPSGDLVVTVIGDWTTDPTTDTVLFGLSPTGEVAWTRAYDGQGAQQVGSMAPGPNGALYLVGSFDETIAFETGTLTSAGDDDVFLAKVYP